MTTDVKEKSCVEAISLAADQDRRIALATVRLGDVLIKGIAIYRTRNGRLRVYFPSYKLGPGFDEVIALPDELREQVELDVLSTYKTAKAAAQKTEK